MHHLTQSTLAALLLLTSLAIVAPAEGYLYRKSEDSPSAEILQPAKWGPKIERWVNNAKRFADQAKKAFNKVREIARTVKKAGKRILDIWRKKH